MQPSTQPSTQPLSVDASTDVTASAGRIILAPMEGVLDAAMRRLLTACGGYSRCVTEFVRVTDVLLPERVFLRLCPELDSGGMTESGVPVFTQLLGSNAQALALNAQRAAALGAPGVDLNFGCPAKTVNNSLGGSILLKDPVLVAHIVKRVRDAVPADIPVTAKIRLGYADSQNLPAIVDGIRAAGATELAIHARTRFDGYKPPAWWSEVASVVQEHDQWICINGEIWSVADSIRARSASGCRHVMLGRGALSAPDLARRIRAQACGEPASTPLPWLQLSQDVEAQFRRSDSQSPRHVGNRTKQWLVYLKRSYPEAADLFARLRTLHDVDAVLRAFDAHRRSLQS